MTAPLPQAGATAAASAFALQQQQLRAQLITAILGLWAGLSVAPSTADISRLVRAILPISLGAQRAMAALTTAQLNQMIRPPRPITIAPQLVTGAALRGRDPADYYERPFREIRRQLDAGRTLGEALDAGRRRAQDLVATDLQLAHTHTAQRVIEASNSLPGSRQIVGYRRQLSNNPNHCALCILASTQRYHVGSLMPIHPNCGCTVVPIYGTEPIGQVIDPALAEQVHDVVARDLGQRYVDPGGRLGDAHYRDIIITNTHGELGPVLGVRGHHFTQLSEPLHLGHIRVNPTDDEHLDAA